MDQSLSDVVALRQAVEADLPAISRIMNYPPEPPTATLLGADRASRLGDLLVRSGASVALTQTTVAVLDGALVGVMDCGSQYAVRMTAARLLRLLPRVCVVLGPSLPRGLHGLWLRQRVQFEPMSEAFPVAKLYVDERFRNRGIGGRLLQHAEELARRGGSPRMCLETGITNPALRLYERHGYRTVATKVSARYERMTGSPGRVLMVKDL
jgi:ribosomal protein S18 acetylase RimI-like enzyme